MKTLIIFLAGCFVGTMAGILVTSLCQMSKMSNPDTDEWKCRRCGCTEFEPCLTNEGPCCWVVKDLCSACITKEDHEKELYALYRGA
jgi:hypothetical protein